MGMHRKNNRLMYNYYEAFPENRICDTCVAMIIDAVIEYYSTRNICFDKQIQINIEVKEKRVKVIGTNTVIITFKDLGIKTVC